MLLRGHKPADLDRYWSQFEIAEDAALEMAEKIREQSDDPQFILTLDHFSQEHRALGAPQTAMRRRQRHFRARCLCSGTRPLNP